MNIVEYLNKRSKFFLTVIGLAAIFILGSIDYFTGSEISFSIFYLLPIILVTWFAGKPHGIFVSLVSAAVWFIADISLGFKYSNMIIPFWNAIMRFGFFLIIVYILSAFKVIRISKTDLEENVKKLNLQLEKKLEETNAELFRRNKELEKSEERFSQIVEDAEEWIWEIDTDGLYTYVSPVVEKILGFKPAEIVGKKHFYDLFSPDVREELKKAAFEVFAKKETFRGFINPNLHKNGNTVYMETSGSPILDKNGKLLGYRGADTNVTEYKQAEEKLKISEEKFFKIFITSPNSIFISTLKEGRIFDINESGAKTFGWQRKEMAGRSADELNLWVNRSDRDTMQSILQEKGTVRNFEADFRRKSGEIFKGSISVDLIEIGGEKFILTIGNDITERKRTEEALKESEENYRLVFEIAQDAIFTLDLKGNFISGNKKAEEMSGFGREELIGKPFMKIVKAKDIPILLNALKDTLTKGVYKFEVELVKKDGTLVPVEVQGSALKKEGKIIGIQGIARDMTLRKKTEDELKRRAEELEKMNKFMVGRETMMIELKKEIDHLLAELGRPEKYKSE